MNDLKRMVELTVSLHALIVRDMGESEEADNIRDQMDIYWYLSEEDKEWLADFSASLYDITNIMYDANEKLAILFKQLSDKIKQLEQFRQELIDDWAESHTLAYDSCVRLKLIDEQEEERLGAAGAGIFYDIPELVEMLVKKIELLEEKNKE